MLCCCTTARLGHESGLTSRTTAPGEKSPRKHCCGGEQKSPDDGRKTPGGENPGDPGHCPCKDSPAKVVAVPEAPSGTADSLTLLSAGVATLDVAVPLDGPANSRRSAARFDHRSSSPSTADILFAHHNLRC